MTVGEAREAARRWVLDNAGGVPGFRGAYTAGSTNWLPDGAEVPATSDLDIMVVVEAPGQAGARVKFRFRDVLLEVSYLASGRLQSPDLVLSDYHVAPSFRTANILLDPLGSLAALLPLVRREYGKRAWVEKRCAHARNRVVACIESIDEGAPLHDQAMAWLFAAGITTHVLLAAGVRNPTVRSRYPAVRDLLAEHGRLEFHETLLELLGVAQLGRERVERHVATLTEVFDAATRAIRTPFPFAADISESGRGMAIEGSREMIGRGEYREAMFWIAVTHSRCQQVLARDAPEELRGRFWDSYDELLADLGVRTSGDVRRRGDEVRRVLPRVWEVAEALMPGDQGVEE